MTPAGDKGGGRVKAEATKRAIIMVTRVASNDDGAGDSGKNNGNGDESAGQVTTRAMAAATTVVAMRVSSNEEDKGAGWATMRVMAVATTVVAMRVASKKEGEGGKAMEMVTRLAGKQWQRQQKGQWQWQRGWRARMPWQTAPPWWCYLLGLAVDAPPFFSLPYFILVQKVCAKLCFCILSLWMGSSTFHEIVGRKCMFLCFYVFWKQAYGQGLTLNIWSKYVNYTFPPKQDFIARAHF
jgi:hypothetical protein